MITCAIQVADIDEEFWCSFIYASNFSEERQALWRDIKAQHDHASFQGKPWTILGDFNETLDLEEHSGFDSSPMITAGMRDFQDLVRYCSLMELRTHGPVFTWCNKREECLICKKLDRVLQNATWQQYFPQSHCVLDSGGCSDHLRGRVFSHQIFGSQKGLLNSQM